MGKFVVFKGKNDQFRVNALRAAGYDPALVQDIDNGLLK